MSGCRRSSLAIREPHVCFVGLSANGMCFWLYGVEERGRRFVPIGMPERSLNGLLVGAPDCRVQNPGLQSPVPGLRVAGIETWRQTGDHLGERAAGGRDDGLAVIERFDDRKSVSFVE